jgi:FAD synthetase
MPLCAPVSTDDNAPVVNGHSVHNASILPICTALAARVRAFLETEAPSPLLKRVQEQTRVALGVIDEALTRYRSVYLL